MINDFLLETQVRDCKLASVVVTSCIGDLQSCVLLAHFLFNFFPVNLELFAFGQGDIELDDETIKETAKLLDVISRKKK